MLAATAIIWWLYQARREMFGVAGRFAATGVAPDDGQTAEAGTSTDLSGFPTKPGPVRSDRPHKER